ncbi:DUF3466 family protein [Vibrio mexicanus]|uniref:DUF3466 family protein n=1 Tax=Vibrio mexicanus TaxID=1004326 RepID=UPI00063CA789|nr:DUF3466 family protein [Vibrio mexicanus]
MSSMNLKLSTVAVTVFTALNANAALYQIVEVAPEGIGADEYNTSYGVAIQPGDNGQPLGCFDNAASCQSSDYALAGETRVTVDGVSYREEAPFALDNGFFYIQDWDDFKNYCYRELLYSTCDSWADEHYAPWEREMNGDTTSNALAFVEGGSYNNKFNNVINSLTEGREPVGNQSTSKDRRNDAVAPVLPTESGSNWKQSRAWVAFEANGDTYVAGSVARELSNNEGEHHTSRAALWNIDTVVELDWNNKNSNGTERPEVNNRLAQGSLRDVAVVDGKVYAVGYNSHSYDDNFMNATVFQVDEADVLDSTQWSSRIINETYSKNGSNEYVYSNSVAESINNNLVAVGSSKRPGSRPQNGAAGNRLFYVPDVTSPTATYFTGGIFFDGAGGTVGAINNYNEFVGMLDAEDNRENRGKPRRKRAFINPISANGTDAARSAIFNNQAWFLDTLTNGDTNGQNVSSHNNQFRIFAASDINDAGVISATATKCEGGYDTVAHNSYCGGGSTQEKTVAVKLIPIAGASYANGDIVTRSIDEEPVERKGGSLGWLGLAVLGLIRFRKK